MSNFSVHLNYPSGRNENDSGIALNFRNEKLRSFRSKEEALRFARSQRNRMKRDDYVYVVEDIENSSKSIFYVTPTKEGFI